MNLHFEEDGKHSLLERLRIVAEAELVLRAGRLRHGVSAHMQKAVLFTILPYEGLPISQGAVAARLGASIVSVNDAVRVLVAQGVLRCDAPPRCRARRYAILYEKLAGLKSEHPHELAKGRRRWVDDKADLMWRIYQMENLSCAAIGRRFGCSGGAVDGLFRARGWRLRGVAEARRLRRRRSAA